MNPVKYIVRYARTLAKIMGTGAPTPPRELTQREFCTMMTGYYRNNDLYSNLGIAMREEGRWSASIKPLRNPTFCAVEFYAATVWPGEIDEALPIVTENPALPAAVYDVWQRSNWAQQKNMAIREGAITGDCFLRIATTASGKPFIQVLRSENVVDWDADHRGNITWLRYEERFTERGESRQVRHLEVWDIVQTDTGQTAARGRTWRSSYDVIVDIENPDKPDTEVLLPVDFLPFVRIPFRHVGDKFGMPAIWNSLDKIDECNLKATRLAEIMFVYGKPFLALQSNMVDADGRPMPPPTVKREGIAVNEASALSMKDDDIWRLPGNATIQHVLADINYSAHLDALKADLDELERELPEIAFYGLMREGDLSGRALAYKMAPAIARAREVRCNFERGLVIANRMAITIGQANRHYLDVGTYEDGMLEHSFKQRDILPTVEADRVDIAKVYVEMGVPLSVVLTRQLGWSEQEVTDMTEQIVTLAVAKAGMTAGPAADPATQSAVRTRVVDAVTPSMETALSGRIDSAVATALERMKGDLAAAAGGR